MNLVDFGLLALTGWGGGLIVGLTGGGGGSILTPLLITAFGVPAPIAVGTDLACAAVTKTAGTLAHRAAHNVKSRIVMLLALGSVPAAIATLAIVALAQLAPHEVNRLIRESVGIALLLSIAMLVLRSQLKRWGARSERLCALRWHRPVLA